MADNFKKYEKLLHHLLKMVEELHTHRKNFDVQQKLDQFYYMQIAEELRILNEQRIETELRLKAFQQALDKKYLEAYHRWSSEVRWLKRYVAEVERSGEKRIPIL